MFDQGIDGVLNTTKLMDEMGIMHTGVFPVNSQGERHIILEKNGIKLGFYTATYGLNIDKSRKRSAFEVNQLN